MRTTPNIAASENDLAVQLARRDLDRDAKVQLLVQHISAHGTLPEGCDSLWQDSATQDSASHEKSDNDKSLLMYVLIKLPPGTVARLFRSITEDHYASFIVFLVAACQVNPKQVAALSAVVQQLTEPQFCLMVRKSGASICRHYPSDERILPKRLQNLFNQLHVDPSSFDDRWAAVRTMAALLPDQQAHAQVAGWRAVHDGIQELKKLDAGRRGGSLFGGRDDQKPWDDAARRLAEGIRKALPESQLADDPLGSRKQALLTDLLRHAEAPAIPERTARKLPVFFQDGSWPKRVSKRRAAEVAQTGRQASLFQLGAPTPQFAAATHPTATPPTATPPTATPPTATPQPLPTSAPTITPAGDDPASAPPIAPATSPPVAPASAPPIVHAAASAAPKDELIEFESVERPVEQPIDMELVSGGNSQGPALRRAKPLGTPPPRQDKLRVAKPLAPSPPAPSTTPVTPTVSAPSNAAATPTTATAPSTAKLPTAKPAAPLQAAAATPVEPPRPAPEKPTARRPDLARPLPPPPPPPKPAGQGVGENPFGQPAPPSSSANTRPVVVVALGGSVVTATAIGLFLLFSGPHAESTVPLVSVPTDASAKVDLEDPSSDVPGLTPAKPSLPNGEQPRFAAPQPPPDVPSAEPGAEPADPSERPSTETPQPVPLAQPGLPPVPATSRELFNSPAIVATEPSQPFPLTWSLGSSQRILFIDPLESLDERTIHIHGWEILQYAASGLLTQEPTDATAKYQVTQRTLDQEGGNALVRLELTDGEGQTQPLADFVVTDPRTLSVQLQVTSDLRPLQNLLRFCVVELRGGSSEPVFVAMQEPTRRRFLVRNGEAVLRDGGASYTHVDAPEHALAPLYVAGGSLDRTADYGAKAYSFGMTADDARFALDPAKQAWPVPELLATFPQFNSAEIALSSDGDRLLLRTDPALDELDRRLLAPLPDSEDGPKGESMLPLVSRRQRIENAMAVMKDIGSDVGVRLAMLDLMVEELGIAAEDVPEPPELETPDVPTERDASSRARAAYRLKQAQEKFERAVKNYNKWIEKNVFDPGEELLKTLPKDPEPPLDEERFENERFDDQRLGDEQLGDQQLGDERPARPVAAASRADLPRTVTVQIYRIVRAGQREVRVLVADLF